MLMVELSSCLQQVNLKKNKVTVRFCSSKSSRIMNRYGVPLPVESATGFFWQIQKKVSVQSVTSHG